MIQDMRAHWQRLTKVMDELFVQARSLHQNWDRITPPENKDAIECYSGPVLDVLDLVNHLHIELVWLAGHIEGSNRQPIDLSMSSELSDALKLVAKRFNVVFQTLGKNEGVECIKVRPEERPNARGDTIIEITPGTAPVSEIAKTLSTTVEKVNGANRRLGLKPAGWVTWKLHDGTIPEPAGTYNLAQWKLLRDDLWPRNHNPCQPFPPDRLVNDEGDE
jgi:hypothetical protein